MSQLVILVGRKGSGKSTTFVEIAQGLEKPTLIIDPGRAKAYTQAGIGFIGPEQIPQYAQEVIQGRAAPIIRVSDVIDKKALVATIFGFNLESGRIDRTRALLNANLIMEDAASYMNSNMTEKLKECVKSFKQYGLNLYLSYHALEEIGKDILRLQPDYVIFKKSGDTPVYSQIPQTRQLPNTMNAMKGFYRAQVYGLTPTEIVEQYGWYLEPIARDLRYDKPVKSDAQQLTFAKWLSKFAHGREVPTAQMRAMKNYQPFVVRMRL